MPGRLMAVESEGGAGGFNNLMLELEGETGRILQDDFRRHDGSKC